MKDNVDIVIADDHPLFRTGLREVIERVDRFSIVGEAGDGEEALRHIRELQPDIAVLDLEMPRLHGLKVIESIRSQKLSVSLIVLTMHDDESTFNAAMDQGVQGYVLKDSAAVDVVHGIEAVMAGKYFISPALTEQLLKDKQRTSEEHPPDEFAALTETERRVLHRIASGQTTPQIAEEMFVSPRTVEHHRSNICGKLKLSGAYALVRFALANKDRI